MGWRWGKGGMGSGEVWGGVGWGATQRRMAWVHRGLFVLHNSPPPFPVTPRKNVSAHDSVLVHDT